MVKDVVITRVNVFGNKVYQWKYFAITDFFNKLVCDTVNSHGDLKLFIQING